jgi:uncharacterized protein
MNDNERQRLSRFLDQLREARASQPDAEAEGLIRDVVAANPDASYLLVQRAMLLEQALSSAKQQLARVTRRTDPALHGGRSPGRADPWVSGGAVRTSESASPAASSVPRYAVPSAATSGGFLGNIATTAAGVVAGSFLYQGIEHLLGHGTNDDGIHGAGLQPVEETTINNFYGSDDSERWNSEDLAADEVPDDGLDSFGDDTFLEGVDDADWV